TWSRTRVSAAAADSARLLAPSRDAVLVTKRIVRDTRGLDDAAAYTVQDPLSSPVFATAAAAEGAHAFTEKRPPAWQH
ncbi:crotonase/enoyl-CoA hydratase family protein, partial [Streptomyces sp. NPDC005921]